MAQRMIELAKRQLEDDESSQSSKRPRIDDIWAQHQEISDSSPADYMQSNEEAEEENLWANEDISDTSLLQIEEPTNRRTSFHRSSN